MAKQSGDIKLIGTLDDITFYKRNGNYFARMKSSLTKQRFWKDKAFEGSRNSCGRMSKASPMASRLYHLLPAEKKKGYLFQTITGKIKKKIKSGESDDEIKQWFYKEYLNLDTSHIKLSTDIQQRGRNLTTPCLVLKKHLNRLPPSEMKQVFLDGSNYNNISHKPEPYKME